MKILRLFGILAALITTSQLLSVENTVAFSEQPNGKIVSAAVVSNVGFLGLEPGIRLYRKIPSEGQYFFQAPLDSGFGAEGQVDTRIPNFIPVSIEELTATNQGIVVMVRDSNHNRAQIRYNNDGSPDLSFGNNGVQIYPAAPEA